MKARRFLAGIVCFAAMLATGCQAATTSSVAESKEETSATTSSVAESKEETSATTAESKEETSAPESSEEASSDENVIYVSALKGPTAMGMTKLMEDGKGYEFTIAGAADEITPAIIQGKIDIACVPANLASVLYNKTEGNIQVLAVNTLGVLYIAENGNSVNSIADLKGKTIYSSGKGATPEFALNYILNKNGLVPGTDVTIEWKTEHAECLSAIAATEGAVAMLPQPFVTTGMMKNENIRIAIDLNKAWDDIGGDSSLLTGVVVARKDFADKNKEAVDKFIAEYADSVKFVNENIDDAAALIEKYDIVPAAVAKKALPACNIVCITGNEMKTKLSGYLQVLFDELATSVGGKLPADDFYYIG